jgi:hypothetical protein
VGSLGRQRLQPQTGQEAHLTIYFGDPSSIITVTTLDGATYNLQPRSFWLIGPRGPQSTAPPSPQRCTTSRVLCTIHPPGPPAERAA